MFRKYHGEVATYASSVRNHFITSLGTAETVANNREKFLRDFYNYQRSAINEGATQDIRAYIVPVQDDQAGADKLAGLLVRQGVDVGVAGDAFRACGRSYAAGSYVIDLAQPAKRLVRTLLDVDVPMDADFLAEQERRRAKGLPDEIYDVTAWSLPLMMNVRADACSRAVTVATQPAAAVFVQPGTVTGGVAEVAYLVPWGQATSVRFLANALRAGLAVKSTDKSFTHQARRYPAGTLILDVADNDASLHERVRSLATETGADVIAVDDSWVTSGPNFGSGNVVVHNAPNVAIAWDRPTNSYSAGNTRFVIERQFDYPVTPIRTRRLGAAGLDEFDVLILPEAGSFDDYGRLLDDAAIDNLKGWVARGGVLIGIGSANRFLADASIDILSIRREDAVAGDDDTNGQPAGGGDDEPPEPTVPGTIISNDDQYAAAIRPDKKPPDSMGGVLARAEVDGDHWLGAGVAPSVNVLVRGSDIYTPITLDKGTNVARFAAAADLIISGYAWQENREQLAYKPFAVVQASGEGFVIAFTQDPNVRAYLDGLNVIFMNAIFRGSAHASKPITF